MDLETLIAKQEITDVVYAYARGIDRLDFELVRSCYPPDAYDDHGAFKGNVDDFIEMCESCLLYTSPSPRDGLLSRMPSSA